MMMINEVGRKTSVRDQRGKGVDDVRVDGGDREDAEAQAEQLDDDAGGEDVPAVENPARHSTHVRRLAGLCGRAARAPRRRDAARRRTSPVLAAWMTLQRPSTSLRAPIGRPSKSTDTPPAPATIGSAGIKLARFSLTTTNAAPCDSIHGGSPRHPSSEWSSALRLPYWRTMSKAPPAWRLSKRR